jgi:hypothetical protein
MKTPILTRINILRRLILLGLIVFLAADSGCITLRKKFIRKKKTQEEAPVYVDFKEYPDKPTKEVYINYYVFTQGWLDDLIETLKSEGNYKRRKHSISEAIMNIEQIISCYNQEGKDKIYPLYQELLSLQKQLMRTPNLVEAERLNFVRKIGLLKSRFEKEFNYNDAEKWML